MKNRALQAVRILLGAILILYAFAKFAGYQFAKLDVHYDVAQMEPALLVFYFFGYSKIYSLSCAAAELIIGLLTMIRRTSRLGLLFYFPFTLNIAIIDWCFGFPLSTRLLISAMTLLSLLLILFDRGFYLTAFFNSFQLNGNESEKVKR